MNRKWSLGLAIAAIVAQAECLCGQTGGPPPKHADDSHKRTQPLDPDDSQPFDSPADEGDSFSQRMQAAEGEIGMLRRGLQSGELQGGVVFPGRDPSGFQPFAPRPGDQPGEIPPASISGLFQSDTGFFHQDPASLQSLGRIDDGSDFRRARLSALGSIAENIHYLLEFDFALFGHPSFRDVWMEVTRLPAVGAVRVGNFREPFSLDALRSVRQLTFLERALPVNAFAPFRRSGVMAYSNNEAETFTWAASVSRAASDPYGGDIGVAGGYAGTGRLTWLPYYDEPSGGRYYLHVGGGYEYTVPDSHLVRFRQSTEFFVGSQRTGGVVGTSGTSLSGPLNGTPLFVDTGNLNVHDYHLIGGELAGSWSSLNFQAEAMTVIANQIGGPTVALPGAYAQVSYFLTGEHRPYNRPAGVLSAVKPFENFFVLKGGEHGKGAWEVAARASWISLNDKNVQGGQLTDLTCGINWYLHPNAKLQFNYIHAFLTSPMGIDSNTDIFAMRAQAAF
ncbi:MAG TPA: porin [Pirellulales bacterium]|nr:porin [Pirellulales bacterium]